MGELLSAARAYLTEKRLLGRERTPHETIMGFTGNPDVIRNFHRKMRFMEQGDPRHEDIRILIIWGPGGQKVATEVGTAKALQRTGLDIAANTQLGISGGMGVEAALYLQATEEWSSIFSGDNVKKRLFDWKRPTNLLDITGLEHTFREKSPTTFDHLKDQATDYIAAVTNAQTGQGEKLNFKHLDDPLLGTLASMNMPIASNRIIEINGKRYQDGCLSCPVGFSWALFSRDFTPDTRPTDILYVSSEPLDQGSEAYYVIGHLWEMFGKNKEMARLLKWMNMKIQQELRFIPGIKDALPAMDREGNRVRIAAIHPAATPLRTWTMNSELLEQATDAANRFTERLFDQLTPKFA